MNFVPSRKALFTVLGTFLVCMYVSVPKWFSYFLKSSLNQLDTDFLFFPYLLENIGNYKNSLMVDSVEKISSSFGLLVYVSKLITELGIDDGTKLMLFFCIQVFIGIVGIYLITTGLRLRHEEIVIIYLFFLVSYFVPFGRYIGGPGFNNKVITSCFALSIGYIILGLFVRGRMVASAGISSFLAYIHPTYSAIFLSIILSHSCKDSLVKRKISIKKTATLFGVSAVLLIPFVINMIPSMSNIAGGGIGSLWWSFLKAKTSNPFPLQDGFVIVIPTLLTFFITFMMLGVLGRNTKIESYDRARWVVGMIISMWLIQIFFTEVIPLSIVARLALTRTTPFALLFMIIVYVVFVWRHRNEDKTGLWIIFLILPVLLTSGRIFPFESVRPMNDIFPTFALITGGLADDFGIYPEILLLFLWIVAYVYNIKVFRLPVYIEKCITFVKKWFIPASVILTILFGVYVSYKIFVHFNDLYEGLFVKFISIVKGVLFGFLHNYSNVFLFGIVICWAIGLKWKQKLNFSIISDFFLKRSCLFITILIIIAGSHHVVGSTSMLFGGRSEEADIEKMWKYIEQHTEKGEMILVVPFFDTRKIPVMPLRPVFLDWSEAQMVLYNPQTTKAVVERLSLMGMDIDQVLSATENSCSGVYQYLYPMCRRILFESYSSVYNDNWRKNLSKMKKIAPNLSYILMKKKYLHVNDRPLYSVGDIVLIELSNVYRQEKSNTKKQPSA
jgi:hypothetical protein